MPGCIDVHVSPNLVSVVLNQPKSKHWTYILHLNKDKIGEFSFSTVSDNTALQARVNCCGAEIQFPAGKDLGVSSCQRVHEVTVGTVIKDNFEIQHAYVVPCCYTGQSIACMINGLWGITVIWWLRLKYIKSEVQIEVLTALRFWGCWKIWQIDRKVGRHRDRYCIYNKTQRQKQREQQRDWDKKRDRQRQKCNLGKKKFCLRRTKAFVITRVSLKYSQKNSINIPLPAFQTDTHGMFNMKHLEWV